MSIFHPFSPTVIAGAMALVCSLAAVAVDAATPDTAKRPNILVIVADDLGFSDVGAFGGEIHTPNLDHLAQSGLRMTQFHTAAACSPTRASLMSGMDPHPAGLANMIELRTADQAGQPGYEGYLSKRVAALPELLRDAGYETILSGKWHLGVEPDQDPVQRGFEKSFASLPAGNNHFGLFHSAGASQKTTRFAYTENGKTLTELPKGFYSSDYFTDRLLGFLQNGKSPRQRPFFAYLAFTAPHWPLQAWPADIAKYRGRYDAGWEVLRHERLERQKQLGLLPPNAQLDPPATLVDWNTLTPEQKRYEAKKMEVYAAMVDRMDWNIGKVIDYLRKSGELEHTIVVFFSDNGAEGGNARHEIKTVTGIDIPATPYEKIGTAESTNSYGPHWAQASTAPHRLYKSNSTEGGITSPAILYYPASARQRQINRQFVSVMDIMPTLLDLAGARHPGTHYAGRAVEPMQGTSLAPYLFGKTEQIHADDEVFGWELFGQRAIRQGSWKITWVSKPNGSGAWALYNLAQDPGERNDLSGQNPSHFKHMLALWEQYARNNKIILHEHLVSPYTSPID